MLKRALLLSGGGFRGAVQVPILENLFYRREYDAVYGISVGALNGSMYAQHDLYRLREIWDQVDGIKNFLKFKWYWPFKGLFSMDPLRKKIEHCLSLDRMIIPFYVGIISGDTGEYFNICSKSMETDQDLWDIVQSAACLAGIMVQKKFYYQGEVHLGLDGGYHNIIPIPYHLYQSIDVVTCKPLDGRAKISKKSNNILSLAFRGLRIFENETFNRDLAMLKYYGAKNITIYSPQRDPGDFMDANKEMINYRYELGEEAYKKPAIIKN